MNPKHIVMMVRAALLAGGFGLAAQASAAVYPYCPSSGVEYDAVNMTHLSASTVCVHLAGGDGFITHADGRRSYVFGFSPAPFPKDRRGRTSLADASLPAFQTEVINGAYFKAQHSAPPLTFRSGQEVYISLTNVNTNHRPDLFDPHTIHFHGFPQAAPVFDGVPESSATINGGSTLTYYYKIIEAGTFMYHCHVESTEHMQMGMLGSLNVLPQAWPTNQVVGKGSDLRPVIGRLPTGSSLRYAYGDATSSATANRRADATASAYDVEYTIQLGSMDLNFHRLHEQVQPLPFAEMRSTYPILNGRGYPETVDPGNGPETLIEEDVNAQTHYSQPNSSLIRVPQGRKALVRIHNLNVVDYFTMTVQGIPMTVVGYGAAVTRGMTTNASGAITPDGANFSYKTTTVTLGGGESADVVLDTTNVPRGTYFLYSSNLNMLSNGYGEDRGGLMTHVVVE